jgi:hypothetical protein
MNKVVSSGLVGLSQQQLSGPLGMAFTSHHYVSNSGSSSVVSLICGAYRTHSRCEAHIFHSDYILKCPTRSAGRASDGQLLRPMAAVIISASSP